MLSTICCTSIYGFNSVIWTAFHYMKLRCMWYQENIDLQILLARKCTLQRLRKNKLFLSWTFYWECRLQHLRIGKLRFRGFMWLPTMHLGTHAIQTLHILNKNDCEGVIYFWWYNFMRSVVLNCPDMVLGYIYFNTEIWVLIFTLSKFYLLWK